MNKIDGEAMCKFQFACLIPEIKRFLFGKQNEFIKIHEFFFFNSTKQIKKWCLF